MSIDIDGDALAAVLIVSIAVYCSIKQVAIAWHMRARAKTIIARGWPPAHLDGDGDPIHQCSCEEEEPT